MLKDHSWWAQQTIHGATVVSGVSHVPSKDLAPYTISQAPINIF